MIKQLPRAVYNRLQLCLIKLECWCKWLEAFTISHSTPDTADHTRRGNKKVGQRSLGAAAAVAVMVKNVRRQKRKLCKCAMANNS